MKFLHRCLHGALDRSALRAAFGLALCLSGSPFFIARGQDLTAQTSNDPAFRRVSNRILCQCGCNYMVLSCNMLDCPSATVIRKDIRTSLAAGQSEEMVLASFVEQFGPRILAEPPREGFFWMGWIMPFVALALGGGLVSYVLWKWKAAPKEELAAPPLQPSAASQATTASAIVEKYRAQIDQELGKD